MSLVIDEFILRQAVYLAQNNGRVEWMVAVIDKSHLQGLIVVGPLDSQFVQLQDAHAINGTMEGFKEEIQRRIAVLAARLRKTGIA